MTQAASETERLLTIRTMAASLPREFSIGATTQGLALLAPALDGNGHDTIAQLDPTIGYWHREALLNAPGNINFLLGLIDRARTRVLALSDELDHYRPPPEKPKNYAAEAALKCDSPAFRRYLREVHQLPDTTDSERINTRLRTLLMIQSRAELNTDQAAQKRWQSLKKDFEKWLKQP